jgi:hypothetical protein
LESARVHLAAIKVRDKLANVGHIDDIRSLNQNPTSKF